MKLYREKDKFIRFGMALGILGLVSWMIPTLSIFINFVCLFCGIVAFDSSTNAVDKAVLSLGIIGLLLTLLRTSLVFFFGL